MEIMNFRNNLLKFGAIALVLLTFSCKKKNTDKQDSLYFSGSLNFEIPDYVRPGEKFTLKPTGVTRSDNGDYGIYWNISNVVSKDTTKYEGQGSAVSGEYVLTIPDTLGKMTVSCFAFADGYQNTAKSKTIVIVNKTRSLSGIPLSEGSFVDQRDLNRIPYINSGNLSWTTSNMTYDEYGVAYDNMEVLNLIYGRYYTWEEAKSVCPEGWRLPELSEWETLCSTVSENESAFKGIAGDLMVNASFNTEKMWNFYPNVIISNKLKMNALPSGFATVSDGKYKFQGLRDYAVFWTSDEYDTENATYVYVNAEKPDVLTGYTSKTGFAASVRCVKDN